MSYSVDVDVLLHASDASSRVHDAARRFLDARPEDPDLLCLAWPTLMAFLHTSTHPGIFARPSAPAEALANVESLLALARVRVIAEGAGFLDAYRAVTARVLARGNLVPDAHLATLPRQHGIRRLYTSDRDFRRFEFPEVVDPLA